jgi:hypothetical protein
VKGTVKRGGVQAIEGEAIASKYKKSMVRTECEDRNSAGTYVRTECGTAGNGGGKTLQNKRGALHVSCVVILTVRIQVRQVLIR